MDGRSPADAPLDGSDDEPARRGRALDQLAAVAVGALLAAGLLGAITRGAPTDFEDLALGPATGAYYARLGDHPIHCRDLRDAHECLEGFRARGSRRAALWLGNSQIHGVNQIRPGDESAPPKLARHLRPRGIDLLAFSQPNANLEEHLAILVWLDQRLPLEFLFLPLVFDDVRSFGLRGSVATALDDPDAAQALLATASGRDLVARHGDDGAGDLAALDQTVQEASETRLTSWLAEHSSLWGRRREARGRLYSWLMDLRNEVFRIDAQTKRRLLEGTYRRNLDAAAGIFEYARAAGIRVFAYVAPLRGDVETPYVESEYARFKRDVQQLADANGATFLDLEGLVPPQYWGQQRASFSAGLELDFMHFQAGGHALLADALWREFEAGGPGT